jgi:hypothetical protein
VSAGGALENGGTHWWARIMFSREARSPARSRMLEFRTDSLNGCDNQQKLRLYHTRGTDLVDGLLSVARHVEERAEQLPLVLVVLGQVELGPPRNRVSKYLHQMNASSNSTRLL